MQDRTKECLHVLYELREAQRAGEKFGGALSFADRDAERAAVRARLRDAERAADDLLARAAAVAQIERFF